MYHRYPNSLVHLSRVVARSQSDLAKRLGGILRALHNMTLGDIYPKFFGDLYEQIRSLGHDGLVTQWLYSHVEKMERRFDLFAPMLERYDAYTSLLQFWDSLEAYLRILGHYDNVVKGGRRMDSIDPNTMEFITMYDVKMRHSSELKEIIDAAEARSKLLIVRL